MKKGEKVTIKGMKRLVEWVFGGILSLPKVGPEGSMPLPDKFDAGYDLTTKDIAE